MSHTNEVKTNPGGIRLSSQHYRFLVKWYYPVIYVLGGMRGNRWDTPSLVKRLGGRVSVDQIKIALSDLLRQGLLRFEQGRIVRGGASCSTSEDVQDASISKYHAEMGQLALEALGQPLDEREMNGLTVAIAREMLPQVKEKIRAFRRELNEFLAPFEGEGDEVYQLNLQLFRLTSSGGSP